MILTCVPAEDSPLQCGSPSGAQTLLLPRVWEGRALIPIIWWKRLRLGEGTEIHWALATHSQRGPGDSLLKVTSRRMDEPGPPQADRPPWDLNRHPSGLRAGDLYPAQRGTPQDQERPLPPWKGPGPHSPAPGRSPCGPELGPESIKAGF